MWRPVCTGCVFRTRRPRRARRRFPAYVKVEGEVVAKYLRQVLSAHRGIVAELLQCLENARKDVSRLRSEEENVGCVLLLCSSRGRHSGAFGTVQPQR